MTPEETRKFTEGMIVKAVDLAVNGSEIQWKAAASAIDIVLAQFRPIADELDEIPLTVIATDKFRNKGKNGWPAWDRITCCSLPDIADHPWSSRCVQAKDDRGKQADATTSDTPNINVNVAARALVKDQGSHTTPDAPKINVNLAERIPVEESSDANKNSDDEARWTDTLTSKRDPVESTVDAQRGQRQRSATPHTAPSVPRPSCSTCLSRGIPCVANVSGTACKGCQTRRKRCDHVAKNKNWSGTLIMSVKPAKRERSQSRGHTAQLRPSVSSSPSPPPAKRQRRQTATPSEESKDIPVIVKSGLPDGTKKIEYVPSSPRTAINVVPFTSPSHRQRVKQVAVTPSNCSPFQADLRPGRVYSLRGEPLVTRDEVVHLDDQQHALMARSEKLEKLYEDMIVRVEKFKEQHDAMVIRTEDLARGLFSVLRILQKHAGESPSTGEVA